MEKVSMFKGEFSFLSNFYPSSIKIFNVLYPTVEHFFQSQKAIDLIERLKIIKAKTPSEAKRLGRNCKLNSKWEEYKFIAMKIGIRAKFDQNPKLKEKLLATGDQLLEEGNDWNDTFWGKDIKTGKGENKLGIILMSLRQKYKIIDQI